MTRAYEALVASRFDALESRFKAGVEPGDFRLEAIRRALGPLRGLRLLDLGCGKGRFARRLCEAGAEVVGLDVSRAMLRGASRPFGRVRGSALRLPFAAETFDAAIAVEAAQHWPPKALDRAFGEVRRVLRRGGRFLLLDRNVGALDARRPWLPALAVKRLDEWRGRWMYRPGEAVRERWFRPSRLRARLARAFGEARAEYLLAPAESARAVFRRLPPARSMVLWTARVTGGGS